MTLDAVFWPLPAVLSAVAFMMAALLLCLYLWRSAAGRERELEKLHRELQRRYASAVEDSRALLNQLPEIVLIFERDGARLVFANRTALELFGCEDEETLSDQVFCRPDRWMPSPYSLLEFEAWLASAGNGNPADPLRKEWCFACADQSGIWLDCEVRNIVFAGRAHRLLTGINIHHRKMENRADRLKERALIGISEGKPVERLLDTAIKLIEVQQPRGKCIISLFDQPRDLLITHGNSGFAREFRNRIPSVPARYGATSIGTAAHTRSPVICDAIHEDHRWQGYSQVCNELGMDSAWSEPVISQTGELLAVITLFSESGYTPDDDLLRQFSSVVSLVSLGIEHQRWKEALEAASANERFIRDIGVAIVNIPGQKYTAGLTAICRRIQAHYNLGALRVWEVQPVTGELVPVAETVRAEAGQAATPIAMGQFEAVFAEPNPEYLTATDELYPAVQITGQGKPVLVIPLYSDERSSVLLGFLAVESRYQFVPTATIEYLRVIGSVLKTSFINRRLMASLSATVESERHAREKLENELNAARTIQMAMVPGSGSFRQQYRAWTLEAWLQPARAVGGDFYEVIKLPDGRVLVAVGDVSDKGVPAALFMARTVSLLNFLARAYEGDPARIATALNEELCRGNDACMFVTMVMGVLDLSSGNSTWINAGHNPPLYVDTLSPPALWMETGGPPFGIYEGISYSAESIRIRPGQSFTLYTDGLTEAFSPDGQAFGEDRLINMGYRAAGQADGLLDQVKERLLEFAADAPQSDDVTLLTIQHHGDRK